MNRSRVVPILLALALLAPATALATPAVHLPLQGALTTTGGAPASDGTYTLTLKLYSDPKATDPIWTEIHVATPIKQGMFAIILGKGTVPAPLPTPYFTDHDQLWLGTTLEGEPEFPRIPLLAVPYAARAFQADKAVALTQPLGADGIATGAVGAAQVGFTYAGSNSKGGPAVDLLCSACVESNELADAAVTGVKLAAGAVEAGHVAFTYAGSASKGGPADSALLADKALLAGGASVADKAKTLECTGCVTLSMLAPDVAGGFLPVTGGTLSGALTAKSGVDLAGSTLSGANFAVADIKTATCGAGQLGRVAIDSGSSKLHFCNGTAWKQLMTCEGICRLPEQVPCGQPVTTDCGDLSSCTGNGSLCGTGKLCDGAKCVVPGDSQGTPAASCKAILDVNASAADGKYWIDPDGSGSAPSAQYTCDMKNGGWTQVLKDDFASSAAGWSPSALTTCGGWTLLGGYGVLGAGGTETRTITSLPVHSLVKTTFNFAKIDSWDGESGWLKVGGVQVWTQSGPTGSSPQICGSGNGGWTEELWTVTVPNLTHADSSVTLVFGSGLDEGSTNESWGLDDVAVWVK